MDARHGFVEQTSGLLDTQVLPGKDESFQFLPELWNLEPGKSLPQVSGIAHQHDSLARHGDAMPKQNRGTLLRRKSPFITPTRSTGTRSSSKNSWIESRSECLANGFAVR
jgi:hypothetical protein